MASSQATETTHVTASMEQYLLAMYCLRRENQPLIGARLAEWLDVSPASVTGMIHRMSQEGLVQVGRGKQITLTTKGWQIALTTARRHYLAERLLTDMLGVDWYRAHVEAERWQHAITDETEEKLWIALGRPTTCPHGSPIPGTGACFSPHSRKLTDVEVGRELIVERISDSATENIDLLKFFQDHLIMPGKKLSVREINSITQAVTVETENGPVALGIEAARQVIVVPAHLFQQRKPPERLRKDSTF
ncbi:iron (metal) dependent repressor, DtxR family [Thermobaculum terrenum ATCC BAA-798]|uniref:Iron (Metal) dependent repressor, DtxR family n=1 Tax=Thermobaculum terrenum (strain ATCC BAA-798 / CCMEE 7001 / YNP1) TaxID=525904 RepID=D1CEB4_THET1|nr:metal-dependent transcriptional regulator [Thermobaculum terrenum]ACZ41270.1 iron (metal) dependent repressor, DtxR family [Thermobaculum terrenum ATCC BAA-798]